MLEKMAKYMKWCDQEAWLYFCEVDKIAAGSSYKTLELHSTNLVIVQIHENCHANVHFLKWPIFSLVNLSSLL